MIKSACISEDGVYRYSLGRAWEPLMGRMTWVMLNPSTADSDIDDPTIRKCIGFAQRWQYGEIVVVNIYAYRATDPLDLFNANKAGVDIVGSENEHHQRDACTRATGAVVAAWGAKAERVDVEHFLSIMEGGRSIYCLGKNKDGSPKHPLYVPYTKMPEFLRD